MEDHPFHDLVNEMRPLLRKDSDLTLPTVALTRKAWCLENPGKDQRHHESLEWLGDRILGAVVAQELWRLHPFADPGQLDDIRDAATSSGPLAAAARRLKLLDAIQCGEGEWKQDQLETDKPLSDHVEALIGAFYLCGGWEAAAHFVREYVLKDLNLDLGVKRPADAKLRRGAAIIELNELVQAIWKRSLSKKEDWTVARAGGADNQPLHEATVVLPDGSEHSAGPVAGNHQMAMGPSAEIAVAYINETYR